MHIFILCLLFSPYSVPLVLVLFIVYALKLLLLAWHSVGVFICFLFFLIISSTPWFTVTDITLEAAIFHSSLSVAIHHVISHCEAVLTAQLLACHVPCVCVTTWLVWNRRKRLGDVIVRIRGLDRTGQPGRKLGNIRHRTILPRLKLLAHEKV